MNKNFLTNCALIVGRFILAIILDVARPQESFLSPQSALATTWELFVVLGPILGFISAREASRFRLFVEQRPFSLIIPRIWLRSIAPFQVLSFLLALGYFITEDGFATDLWRLGIFFCALHIFIWSLVGAVLGLFLPFLVALPLALFLPFALLAYPPALNNPAWRYMFGQAGGICCEVDQSLDPLFIRASSIMLITLVVASVLALAAKTTSQALKLSLLGASAILLVAGGSTSYVQASDGNYYMTVQRNQSEMICSATDCVWPETPPEYVEANRQAANSLGLHNAFFVDKTEPEPASKPNNFNLVHITDIDELRNYIIGQRLSRDSELAQMDSCWSDDDGPVSVAHAITDVSPDVLHAATLDAAGHLRTDIDRTALRNAVNSGCGA